MAIKIIHATGQMCNQFWIISNYLADCIEEDKHLSLWLPDFNIEQFNKLCNSKFISFPLYPKKIVQLFGYKNWSKFIKLFFSNKLSVFLTNKIFILVPGINFMIIDVISCKKSKYRSKHIKTILDIFLPNSIYIDEVVNQIENKVENELLIGIHIRHGDYRTFNNGKYFYSLEQYNDLMTKIREVFIDKNVKFFIASNEKIDYRIFEKHDIVKITNSSALKDLIGLSKCDYICGPPSSFSAWASLYNDSHLYFIEDIKADINEISFINIKKVWF